MANWISSLTIPLSASEIPHPCETFADLDVFLNEQQLPSETLEAISLRGWLYDQVVKVTDLYGCTSLSYFSESAAVVQGDHLKQAITELASLIARLGQNPSKFINSFRDPEFTTAEVANALSRKPTSLLAAQELLNECKHWGYDLGDSIWYFVSFLYAHLFVLQYCQDKSLCALFTVTD